MIIKEYTRDKKLIADAASSCYGIPTSQGHFALQTVIERLVLPEETRSFSEREIAMYISEALYDRSKKER